MELMVSLQTSDASRNAGLYEADIGVGQDHQSQGISASELFFFLTTAASTSGAS